MLSTSKVPAATKACGKCKTVMLAHNTICPNCKSQQGLRVFAMLALCTMLLMAVGAIVKNFKDQSQTPEPTTSQTLSSAPTDDAKKTLALMVNLSGQLCAKVVGIKLIDKNLVEVDCIRYRDSSIRATYNVDLLSMSVK